MPAALADTITVTFDKSHLITIGEKLYGESMELLRELIANAYDADAANVWIEVREESLTVRDDGSGMDEEGLREFFRIGSQNKQRDPISPKYRRPRVGQFGIGKFAVLTACERFLIFTQKDGFAAEVVFDKNSWNADAEGWRLPLRRPQWNDARRNGTTVTLERLTKAFVLPEIERFIRERLPLSAPHFAIVINGKRITPHYIPGRRFPVSVETRFGWITGELVLPNIIRGSSSDRGIECVVRGVVICKTVFGLDLPVLEKLRGRVTADFVPITSDRSRFILDSEEYRAFASAMEKEIRRVSRDARELAEKRERQKADETLKDMLSRMRRAIRKNPDIAPPLISPTGEVDAESERQNAPKMASPADSMEENTQMAMHIVLPDSGEIEDQTIASGNTQAKEPPPKKIRIKNLAGKTIIARKIMIGGVGITCSLEHCGEEQPAAFTDGGIVFLNMDHPLFVAQQKKGQDMLGFYLSFLLAQQVALLLAENDARKAFHLQERLLTDSR